MLLTFSGKASLIQFSHAEQYIKGNSVKLQSRSFTSVWRKWFGCRGPEIG
jgi:hypothetical protein